VGYLSDGETRVPVLIADAFVERFVVEPASSGPLRGTTFAAKDVFDVAGRSTGCGNPDWRATHSPAATHAAAVQLLLGAGARLVGKTRTDELAYSLDGSNFHEGAPRNPAAPERLTGGSSSGPASAVAAGDVDFALATDTAGSVRVPGAWCGLFGVRPTHGRVSAVGVTPLAPSFDTVGWLARSVAMLRKVGGVLFPDPAPPAPVASVVRDPALERLAPDVPAAMFDRLLERRAARVPAVSSVSLGIDFKAAAECLRILQGGEVWSTHGRWIESVRPSFGPGVAARFAAARGISGAKVQEAARERAALCARLDAALPPGCILCLPTVPGPAPRRDASPEQLQLQRMRVLPLTALASLSGRPQITLPLDADGAPVGFSLLGWRHGDEALLEIAERLAPA
jgi:amidase